MRYVSRCLLLVLFCFSPIFAYGGDSAEEVNKNIHTEEVEYAAGGVTLKGYLAYDTSIQGKRPGVLVVHEWWGHNEYARKRARMLAKLGYTALAVDMYGSGKTADHPDDATLFMNEVLENMDRGEARFNAALGILKRHPATDTKRIAAIGYCFGGGVVLHMARIGADLRGVASFHGSLGSLHTPESGSVEAKVLVLHGADDKLIPPEQVEAFKSEMAAARVNYWFIAYPGAMHSFTNPDADKFAKRFDMPLGYNEKADRLSWKEMKKFFEEVFTE
ncbi:MAG: dienelactone hydrolase family protein [Deltaproteobacteria bacterium]|nr:dienelactone hydrolase family protein [Deltaproteobacteria bacterium]